ncbi:hypothetical protein GGR58DRAFT_501189 [Xylaria digitata]|nr:hypothetical protein GGR58DRAFT_501189 [Xylaria digitata]
MLPHSRSAKERATMSGVLVATHAGDDQLRIYLDSRLEDARPDRCIILEIALSLETARGDAPAIESLVRYGVNVDTPMLVDKFCTILKAAKNSQIDALSAVVNTGPDVKRISAYFLRRHPSWSYEVFNYLFRRRIVPKLDAMSLINIIGKDPLDERLVDPILQTSVQIDTLLHGINLIQLTIQRFCGIKAVRFLHSRGVEIHRFSPYQEAVELVEFLLDNGTHCKIDVEQGGPTILELFAFHGGRGNWSLELFITLLDRDASVNGPKERQKNLSGVSSKWEPTSTQVDGKAARHCNFPFSASHDRTALQAACDRHDVSLGFVRHLSDRGARVNDPGADCGGFTALQCAINARSISVLCLLLDASADINASANHYSLEEPDWHLSQKQGDTPYDGAIELAEKRQHHAIAKMLRDRYEEQIKEAKSATIREQGMDNIAQQELHWTSNTSSLLSNGPRILPLGLRRL